MDAPDRLLKQLQFYALPQFSAGSYGTKGPPLKQVTISPFFRLQFLRNGYRLIQQLTDLN
jgi:hypothetical protein